MTSLSLKWSISLWISAVLIAVIATISIVAYIEFEEFYLRSIDQILKAMANGIVSSLDTSPNKEKWTEEVNKVTGRSDENPSTLYRIWLDGSSDDLIASDEPDSEYGRWLHELSEQNKPLIEQSNFLNFGLPHNEYRAVWMRHKINGDIVNIVVAGTSHFTYHELYEFLRLLLVLGASLIIGSIVATMWTVRCGLLPIDMTAERLQDITRPNIGEVIFDYKKVPRELRPFVEALNDMLSRLDRVLQQQKQFTSDAAHELRTPLSLAKSTLQAAQIHERQPAEYRQAINDSLEDIARMEHLIEQLLVLARLDEVDRATATEEVQLDVLLRELAELYGKKMECSGGKVIFEEPPETAIQGDLDELIRLFSNVLDNAVKYGSPDGTIRLSLECEPDGYATICIHNEGGNIPPDTLPHLFDRFYRADPSRSKSTGGAGLGLAIAREIARRHNGDISITSSPDSGTLVCIRLARA
jgi:heavy metal sensor kinase